LEFDNVTPLYPYVLVKRLPPETEFKHLMIVLPDEQNYKNRKVEILKVHRGKVLSNGVKLECDVKPGDIAELIVFDGDVLNKNSGGDIEMCREENILAVYE